MKSIKLLKLIVAICISSVSFNIFAADQMAKEETSPSSEEGPLTIEQIPPVKNIANPSNTTAAPINPSATTAQSPAQPASTAAPGQQ